MKPLSLRLREVKAVTMAWSKNVALSSPFLSGRTRILLKISRSFRPPEMPMKRSRQDRSFRMSTIGVLVNTHRDLAISAVTAAPPSMQDCER